MDWRDLERAYIKKWENQTERHDDNEGTKMTNAEWNKLYDTLINPLQLTIKLEDAIKMLESGKNLLHQQVIFHDQYNSICTLG